MGWGVGEGKTRFLNSNSSYEANATKGHRKKICKRLTCHCFSKMHSVVQQTPCEPVLC